MIKLIDYYYNSYFNWTYLIFRRRIYECVRSSVFDANLYTLVRRYSIFITARKIQFCRSEIYHFTKFLWIRFFIIWYIFLFSIYNLIFFSQIILLLFANLFFFIYINVIVGSRFRCERLQDGRKDLIHSYVSKIHHSCCTFWQQMSRCVILTLKAMPFDGALIQFNEQHRLIEAFNLLFHVQHLLDLSRSRGNLSRERTINWLI